MNRREAILLAVKVLLQKGYEWLARDKDGTALAYDQKPFKINDEEWNFDDGNQYIYLDNAEDIDFVKWEDDEPTNIAEWIKKEEEEMIDRREARYASVGALLGSGYLWLARDLNGSIAAYSHKPFKLDDEGWRVEEGESKEMWMWVDDGDLYNFVKWEDEEPTNIDEWLKKEEEEMKMCSVKDGELECREVDADFFEKNTTLGGLLTPKEVELDRDNKIVTDDYMWDSNGQILEKAKTLGGLLKNTNTKSMNSQEKQLYCAGEKVNIGDQIFVAKENEVFTVADIMTDGTVVTTPNINGGTRYFRPELVRLLSGGGTGDEIESPSYEPSNVQIHGKICQELTETYEKKNSDYGNSFENSLDKHGLIAGIVRMDDKMSRLISLNSKNEQLVMDESLRDTLMDLANYAIMSVMWLDEQ